MTDTTSTEERAMSGTDDRLRQALLTHHPIMRSETGPLSGCRCGAVGLGQDVIAHVVGELRAYGDLRAAEELREMGRLLGHVPLSEREQLRKGERMQVSDYTAGFHAAANAAFALADALTAREEAGR